ncbi:MAG: glycosyltransferase family 39 protein [Lentisphaerota bacterium]
MSIEKIKSQLDKIGSYLWGDKFSPWYLIFASLIVMFFFLGSRDLWTQESRWANICQQMIIRHDYFHPFLDSENYYDKPLLSYWMMIGFSYIFGLGKWALRIPGVFAGLISIWACYKIGEKLSGKRAGVIGAWMLLGTFWFVFWSRVSCADMLNVGGIMFAVAWFIIRKEKLNFTTYIVLFLSLTVTSLCKGLVAPVVAGLILLPLILHDRQWKEYLKPSMWIAGIICAVLYAMPFIISSLTNTQASYQESGLYLVFRENILRYVKPFDHEEPYYTYFVYLPLYSAPWIIFTLVGLYTGIRSWKTIPFSSKFYIFALVLVFIFFTLSGSRRSYYVLPMVPLAILIASDWLKSNLDINKILSRVFTLFLVISLIAILIYQLAMAIAYSNGGSERFASDIEKYSTKIKPLNDWNMVYVSMNEDDPRGVNFFLGQNRLPTFTLLEKIKLDPNSSNILVMPLNIYNDNFAKEVLLAKDKYQLVYSKPVLYKQHKKIKAKDLLVAIIPNNTQK